MTSQIAFSKMPFLKMGVHATVGEALLPLITVCNEGIVSEVAIVGMVVFDCDIIVGGKFFKH